MPFPGFASLLRWSGSPGYGIIHWTTRPLDLYFKSLSDQVWNASENETLDTTCQRMAERTFGVAARETATHYLSNGFRGPRSSAAKHGQVHRSVAARSAGP